MTKRKPPKYSPGETLCNDGNNVFLTIEYANQTSYKFTNGEYMPITLVDRYWYPVDIVEIED